MRVEPPRCRRPSSSTGSALARASMSPCRCTRSPSEQRDRGLPSPGSPPWRPQAPARSLASPWDSGIGRASLQAATSRYRLPPWIQLKQLYHPETPCLAPVATQAITFSWSELVTRCESGERRRSGCDFAKWIHVTLRCEPVTNRLNRLRNFVWEIFD